MKAHHTSLSEIFTNTPKTNTRQRITVKKKYTLELYKEIVFLTKDYYNAIKNNKPLPTKPLPDLNIVLEAATVVNAYMTSIHISPTIKLYNSCLDAKTIVTVWLFANEPTLNIKLGSYQLLAINHQ